MIRWSLLILYRLKEQHALTTEICLPWGSLPLDLLACTRSQILEFRSFVIWPLAPCYSLDVSFSLRGPTEGMAAPGIFKDPGCTLAGCPPISSPAICSTCFLLPDCVLSWSLRLVWLVLDLVQASIPTALSYAFHFGLLSFHNQAFLSL